MPPHSTPVDETSPSPHAPARGTQSFVHILAACARRPSLLATELLWRWLFGLPLLAILLHTGLRIWTQTAPQLRATGLFDFSLQMPMNGALSIAEAYEILRDPLLHAAAWILPLAILAAAIASGLGRNAVLRRYAPHLPWRPAVSVALQLLRLVVLCAIFAVWFAAIRWAANYALAGAASGLSIDTADAEPNLVLYCALVIIISLGIFTVWALLSWIFSIAPLLAILEDRGIAGSLRRSARLGPLTGKLVEINMLMGIVKLSLIVLAMVLSATPLPFEDVVHGPALYAWWIFVTILYLIASDLFQVARIAAFVELWRLAVQAKLTQGDAHQK